MNIHILCSFTVTESVIFREHEGKINSNSDTLYCMYQRFTVSRHLSVIIVQSWFFFLFVNNMCQFFSKSRYLILKRLSFISLQSLSQCAPLVFLSLASLKIIFKHPESITLVSHTPACVHVGWHNKTAHPDLIRQITKCTSSVLGSAHQQP